MVSRKGDCGYSGAGLVLRVYRCGRLNLNRLLDFVSVRKMKYTSRRRGQWCAYIIVISLFRCRCLDGQWLRRQDNCPKEV